jgi:hypothetical protein
MPTVAEIDCCDDVDCMGELSTELIELIKDGTVDTMGA